MAELKEIVKNISAREKAYSEEEQPLYHINCAEALLMASNDKYDLGMDTSHFKLMAPFGGGFYSGKTCGALCGSLAAIGSIYGQAKPYDNTQVKELAAQLVEAFEQEFGQLDCDYIKEHHADEEEGCLPVKMRAADVLEKVLQQAGK